jgi:hypothetical protein
VKPEASDSSQVLPDLLKGGSVFETAGTRSNGQRRNKSHRGAFLVYEAGYSDRVEEL